MMNSFWWGDSHKDRNGIRWMSWDRLCEKKGCGGMSFRKIHEFSMALLWKQAWRFLTNPNLLVSQIYKARYFSNCSFLEASLGNNPSYTWRSIFSTQELIRSGAKKLIGDGSSVSVFNDLWLPDMNPFPTTIPIGELDDVKVDSLLLPNTRAWDEDLITDIFDKRDAYLIKGMPLSRSRNDG